MSQPRITRSTSLAHLKCHGTSRRLSAWGPYVTSAISGGLIEKRKAILVPGVGWVSADPKHGEYDRPFGKDR